jgi:signal transduction histidine kinase/HAMP domain-containing protein
MRGLAWTRTLRGRVLGAVLLGVLCQLGAVGFEVVQFRRIGDSVATVNESWLPLARLTARMEGQLDRPRSPEPHLDDLVDDARAAILRGQALARDGEEAANLRAADAQLDDIVRAAAAAAAVPDGEEARRTVRDEVLQLGALAEARVSALSQRTARAQQDAVRLSLVLAGLSVPLGAALLWLAGTALRPVRTLTQQVRRLEAGERPGPVDAGGDDEIGTLARAFDAMARAVDERDRNLQAVTLQLRRVLDSLISAVAVVEGGRVLVANPAADTLWQLREGAPLPEALAALPEGRQELVVGDRTQDVFVAPFGGNGRILVGEDVTERLRDRERLVRSERLALVGQLLAQVTHEVRNPLNAMSLHAELLADELAGTDQAALLTTVVDEIRRLEAVTERYLDLARRRAPELAPEDPVALARGVVALEDERLRRLDVEVRVEAEPCAPVEIDGNVLRRALLNLVRNAAEAGAHLVIVGVRREGAALVVTVSDDGPGMEEQTSARVFEPFFSTKARGTGLGLAVTRQGIEDLGGSVQVASHPGRGTTFTIRVPT